MVSKDAQIAVALGTIFAVFLVVAIAIIWYMFYKYRRRSFLVSATAFQTLQFGNDDEATEEPAGAAMDEPGVFVFNESFYGKNDIDTHASTILIPYTLQLLKTCKALTHRLMASIIDGTGHDHNDLVTGSLPAIISTVKAIGPRVDALTKCLYPPVNTDRLESCANLLVTSIDELCEVTRTNCHRRKIGWMESLCTDVHQHYKQLQVQIMRYHAMVQEHSA